MYGVKHFAYVTILGFQKASQPSTFISEAHCLHLTQSLCYLGIYKERRNTWFNIHIDFNNYRTGTCESNVRHYNNTSLDVARAMRDTVLLLLLSHWHWYPWGDCHLGESSPHLLHLFVSGYLVVPANKFRVAVHKAMSTFSLHLFPFLLFQNIQRIFKVFTSIGTSAVEVCSPVSAFASFISWSFSSAAAGAFDVSSVGVLLFLPSPLLPFLLSLLFGFAPPVETLTPHLCLCPACSTSTATSIPVNVIEKKFWNWINQGHFNKDKMFEIQYRGSIPENYLPRGSRRAAIVSPTDLR